jgi:hemoglobin
MTNIQHTKADIASRDDVMRLVKAFYDQVRTDAVLGPIFEDVAHVDWARHLPKMYDFWETVLFGKPAFTGNPLAVHRALARRTALTPREFDRWLEVFHVTVDRLFTGEVADLAKLRSSRIAVVMQHHIAIDQHTSLSQASESLDS